MYRVLNFEKNRSLCYLALIISFSFFHTPVFALPEDSEKTLNIVATSSLFNYKTGVNIYKGNVNLTQGSAHLTADRVVTQNNKQHKITIATAYGLKKKAEYTTIPKIGDPVFRAKAKIIKFFPLISIVRLEGNVTITQGENSFQGPVMIYNIKNQSVEAPASKLGRSTVVIEPAQIK
jgi:lipopolysaccharide export system protein LptA